MARRPSGRPRPLRSRRNGSIRSTRSWARGAACPPAGTCGHPHFADDGRHAHRSAAGGAATRPAPLHHQLRALGHHVRLAPRAAAADLGRTSPAAGAGRSAVPSALRVAGHTSAAPRPWPAGPIARRRTCASARHPPRGRGHRPTLRPSRGPPRTRRQRGPTRRPGRLRAAPPVRHPPPRHPRRPQPPVPDALGASADARPPHASGWLQALKEASQVLRR